MSKLDSLATVAALETLLALTPSQRAQVLAELPEHIEEIEHWRTRVSDLEEQLRSAIDAHAAVLAELPESKPTAAWQRLGEFLADRKLGPWRHWSWSHWTVVEGDNWAVSLTDKSGPGVTIQGEGPTLDEALSAALEKLK